MPTIYFSIIFIYLLGAYVCVYMCVYIHTGGLACMGKSEDILQKSVLLFHHVGPRDQTQVVRFGSKHLYLQKPSHQAHVPLSLLPVF